MEAKFRLHSWDTDEDWQKIRRAIEIPPNRNEYEIILNRKRKYYKANIDPSYEAPPEPKVESSKVPPQPTSPSSSSSSSSSASSSSSSSAASSGWRSSSDPHDYGYGPFGPATIADADIVAQKSWQAFAIAVANAAIVALTISYATPFLSADLVFPVYNYVLRTALAVEVAHFCLRVGRPRFTKEYAQFLVRDEQAHHIAMQTAYFAATPVFIILVPSFVRAMSRGYPYLRSKLPPFLLARLVDFVPTRLYDMFFQVALAEVVLGLMSIIYIFTPVRSFVFTLLLWQLLRLRHIASPFTRKAFSQVRQSFDPFFQSASMPSFVTRAYQWVMAMLKKSVDPVELQRQAEAAQSKKCTIM